MALNPTDLYDIRSLLSEEERMIQDAVARFTDEKIIPIIGDAFSEGRFPKELVPEIASMGLLGSSLPEKYGCAGLNSVSYGLICQELERGDSGVRSFCSVQGSLCMYPIYAYGSEEQRRRLLPRIASGTLYSAIGMSEHEAGSDLAAVATKATRTEDGWLLNGSKVWTSGAHLAHQIVVLARTSPVDPDRRHAGFSQFIVPTDLPGISISSITA